MVFGRVELQIQQEPCGNPMSSLSMLLKQELIFFAAAQRSNGKLDWFVHVNFSFQCGVST